MPTPPPMSPPAAAGDPRRSGMRGFAVVWSGQILSVLASTMTHFGITLWVYKQTESATAMAGMQVAFILPIVLLTPFAGAMVDRHDRKLTMMVSDLAAASATAGVLALYASGHLQLWHLYVSSAVTGVGHTFQWPAWSAAISTMLPKEQYGRANGLMSLIDAGPGVVAPMLAGILLAIPLTRPLDGFGLIMLLDLVTFFVAIGALLAIHVPQPARTLEGRAASGGLLREAWFGFAYIFRRRSLLGLQLVFLVGNLFSSMAFTLLAPMVLARSGQDSVVFGSVQTAGAVGGVVGGIVMSAWGGFRRRVHGVLLGWVLSGLSMSVVGLGRGLPVWVPAMFLVMTIVPVVNASNQAIWQDKVAPDIQGRVFSARRLIAMANQPIAPMIAGVLADVVLEPRMRTGAGLADLLGPVFGTGPGAGMGVLVFCCGLCASAVGISACFVRAVRDVEILLPDHDELTKADIGA